MVDKLVANYVTEVQNKIALKMIPNKTEEQILYLNFKHCDLSNSGHCNLRDFIKTNDRIGVVMPKIKNLETIFHYFDKESNDSIDYRAFSKNLFKNNLLAADQNNNGNEGVTAPDFISRLQSLLLSLGGNVALINFANELLLIDSSCSLRITLDDLLRVCADCKFKLTNDDVQLLFHSFDLFNNGIFHYTKVLHQLKNIYWNSEREAITIKFSSLLLNNNKKYSIEQFKKRYKGEDKEKFNKFIDSFKYIMKYANRSSPIDQKDIIEFVKYFGFGIESNEEINQILNDAFLNDSSSSSNSNQAHYFTKTINDKEKEKEESKSSKVINAKFAVFDKLKQVLSKFGRKTLFNFVKHFKHYDNGTKFISKYDFVKILKDFNIHLPIIEIENLFEQFARDKNKASINYDIFISDLITSSLNEEREEMILETYDAIATYAESIKAELTIDFLKGFYHSKNDPKGKDENELLNEFNECIEMFLLGYKSNKGGQVTKEDFSQFYSFISFLVHSDDELSEMLHREWSKCFTRNQKDNHSQLMMNNEESQRKTMHKVKSLMEEEKEDIAYQKESYCKEDEKPKHNFDNSLSNHHQTRTSYNQEKVQSIHPQNSISKQDSLTKLKMILRSRGIRGLIYLHKQFLLSCSDLNSIQYDLFIQVLNIQHIKMAKHEFQTIFDMFPLDSMKGRISFHNFIRAFKKELNEKRLSIIEQCFIALEKKQQSDHVPIDILKLKYNASQHPDCLSNRKSEDDLAMEFLDCIEQNYSLLGSDEDQNDGHMTFEMFANFYEYVSFLYDNDDEFEDVVRSTWDI